MAFHFVSCQMVLRMKWGVDGSVRLCWSALHVTINSITSRPQLGVIESRSHSWARIRSAQVMGYGQMVHRRERGSNVSRLINAPRTQQDYMKYFNAVDLNDWDSADYLTSIRTNRYYLRIFCWYSIGSAMFSTWWYVTLSTRESERANGVGTWRKSLADTTFRSTLAWPCWTEPSNGIGMAPQKSQAGCDSPQSYRATVISVFSVSRVSPVASHIQLRRSRRLEYKCGTRLKTNKCTGERLNLGLKSGRYCGMCYQKQVSTELKAKERKGRCRTSNLGCAICKELICVEWEGGVW